MRPVGWEAKLGRAGELLELLRVDVASFVTGQPYELVNRDRDDEIVYELRLAREPPLRLAAIAGELAHDLRSALDHLARALVERNGGTPSRDTAFPIQRDRDDQAFERQTRGMSPTHVAAVRDIQPYMTDRPDNDWLLRLHDFNRIDKHRLLHVVATVMRQTKLTIGGGSGVGEVRLRWRAEWGWPKFAGVLGGQAIGFDAAAGELVVYIPVTDRIVSLEFPPISERIVPDAPVRFSAPRPTRPADSSVEVYPEIALNLIFAEDATGMEMTEVLQHFLTATEAVPSRVTQDDSSGD